MKSANEKALLALLNRMDGEIAYIETLTETLPNFKARSAEWDATIAKFHSRRRGDRSKLNGSVLVEEVAVDLLKWRRRLLREEVAGKEALAVDMVNWRQRRLTKEISGQEEYAMNLVKWRWQQLRREGLGGDTAWEQALQEVALEFHVSVSTLEDWYKGKSRRKRKKREGGF